MSNMSSDDERRTITDIALLICGCILACALVVASTYYCTTPRLVDQEAQAVRAEMTRQMISCQQSGGSWMPVYTDRYESTADDWSMSCVTDKTLPMAQEMNAKKEAD